MSTVGMLQLMKLCSIQGRICNCNDEKLKKSHTMAHVPEHFYFGCCKPPWNVHLFQPINSSVKIVLVSNTTLTKPMKYGTQLLKCCCFVSWRWAIWHRYAEAGEVLPFYLPKPSTTLHRIGSKYTRVLKGKWRLPMIRKEIKVLFTLQQLSCCRSQYAI